MKHIIAALIAAPLLVLMGGCSQHHVATTASGKTVYGEQAQIIERLRNAGDDLKQLMNAPDNAIPQDVLSEAKCIAVVPDMVKGGVSFLALITDAALPLAAPAAVGASRHSSQSRAEPGERRSAWNR